MANPSPSPDLIFPIEMDSAPSTPSAKDAYVTAWLSSSSNTAIVYPNSYALRSSTDTAIRSSTPSPASSSPRSEPPAGSTSLGDMATDGFRPFSSANEDIVTTVHYNYYGTRQVTASSDKTIRVFEEKDNVWTLVDTWTAHDAEVRDAKWSSPFWGQIIGSIGEDMKFKVWQENTEEAKNTGRRFQCIYSHSAPAQVPYVSLDFKGKHHPSHDTFVALISRTGYLEIYQPDDNEAFSVWQRVDAFQVCTPPSRGEETGFKVCFSPDPSPSFNAVMAGLPKDSISLVAGAMNEAKVYRTDSKNQYFLAATLTGHRDLVRDVSWASSGEAKGFDLIATACKDGRVRIFKVETPHNNTNYARLPQTSAAAAAQDAAMSRSSMIGAGLASVSRATGAGRVGSGTPGQVKHQVTMVAELASHGGEVWRVRFDRCGSLLASAGDDGKIKMWRQAIGGQWMEYSEVTVDTAKEFCLELPAADAA
ncbi:MAG: epoxide hydrolase, soluble (sEH) [Candelina submexicana]|nr:MAG: epoxide hydrolase, soluble (sEH) [Candelina submexicana]